MVRLGSRLALVLVATCFPGPARAQDEFRWTGRIAEGKQIEIKGVNGSIRAEAASGNDVEVIAAKRARSSDPASVTFEVLQHETGVTICAVYPTPTRGSRSANVCRPGEEGRMNTRDNDVNVEFTVRVPRAVHFVGRTVNGRIEARSLGERVEAYTVNGPISIATRGVALAETVNGSIDASLGRADWVGTIDFRTVNGSITLTLPSNTNARVRADAFNGAVSSDFAMTIDAARRGTHRRVSGTIGNGGRDLRLHTINGTIVLKKS